MGVLATLARPSAQSPSTLAESFCRTRLQIYLPQPIQAHIKSFGTLRQLLKKPKKQCFSPNQKILSTFRFLGCRQKRRWPLLNAIFSSFFHSFFLCFLSKGGYPPPFGKKTKGGIFKSCPRVRVSLRQVQESTATQR